MIFNLRDQIEQLYPNNPDIVVRVFLGKNFHRSKIINNVSYSRIDSLSIKTFKPHETYDSVIITGVWIKEDYHYRLGTSTSIKMKLSDLRLDNIYSINTFESYFSDETDHQWHRFPANSVPFVPHEGCIYHRSNNGVVCEHIIYDRSDDDITYEIGDRCFISMDGERMPETIDTPEKAFNYNILL